MTELATAWSRGLGLTAPIVNAPMGGTAGGALAAAVSAAGGLGMVGMGSSGSAAALSAELRHLQGLEQPFGIGLVQWVVARDPDLLEVALSARPALLAVSFGDDWSWIARAHDHGIRAAAQVGDLSAAVAAVTAGADVVVVRGAEGGGHGAPTVGTLPLLADVLDEVPVPVLAAGGISTGRAVAAVLAAGAAGAWVGTAFAACTEALGSEETRRVLLDADGTDTVTTRVVDIALGYPWPEHLPERVVRTEFVDRWTGREEDLRRAGPGAGTASAVNAGQGVGRLRTVRPAAAVVDDLCTQARDLLRRWG